MRSPAPSKELDESEKDESDKEGTRVKCPRLWLFLGLWVGVC